MYECDVPFCCASTDYLIGNPAEFAICEDHYLTYHRGTSIETMCDEAESIAAADQINLYRVYAKRKLVRMTRSGSVAAEYMRAVQCEQCWTTVRDYGTCCELLEPGDELPPGFEPFTPTTRAVLS